VAALARAAAARAAADSPAAAQRSKDAIATCATDNFG
jgi:hypothetical protein